MKHKFLLKSMLLLCALIAGSSSVWATDPVSSVAPENGKSYVVAYYANNKYYALPHGSSSGVWDGTEVTLNGINKVNTTTAENLAWTLTEGTTSGQFYLTYPSGNTTKYLTKSGSTGDNKNLNVVQSSGNDHYWEFTLNSGNSDYTVKSLKSITANTTGSTLIYLGYATAGKFGVYAQASAAKIILLEIGDDPNATPTCATPTISPASGAVLSGTEVTLTTTTEGATIYYTMGADPADPTTSSTPYDPNDKPTITAATTIKAIAAKDGSNNSTVASASYTIVTPLSNIAALTANTNTSAETKYVTLTDAVVTFTNGSYAYIQDASGAVLYYKSGHGLTAGDVLNGTATVTYQLRNSNPQITALSGVTPTTGGAAPDPTEVAQSAWGYTFNNVLSQYFKITGATITSSDSKYYVSLGGENVQLYKIGTALGELNLTKKYTITGFPTLYNTTKEMYIFATPVEEVSTDPIIAATPTSLTGFMYIPGNGPSATKSISVTGANLTADITLTASTNYELSTTENSGYTNSLTLTQTAGAVTATTVYVRMKAGLTSGDYNGTITLTSTGATDVTVNLTGSVITTASLPFSWIGSSSDGYEQLAATTGVETNLTSNYATSNAPYRLKFDDAGKYVIIYTNEKPEAVTFTAKIFGATTTDAGTKIKVQGSANGITFDDIQEFTIKGASNATFEFTTSNDFDASHKAVKLILSNKDQGIGVGLISISSATAAPVTIPAAGYTTYCNTTKAIDFTGVTAYKVSAIGADYVTIEPITQAPANTPVIIEATAGTHNLGIVANAASVGTNLLLVSDGTIKGNNLYALASKGNPAVVGFYKVKSTVTIPAGKCYLDTNTSAPEFLGFDFNGETTEIADVRSKMEDVRGDFFDLQGRKVANPTKGLYIVNGKKVVIK